MKRIRICWHCIGDALAKIHLVDRFLLVFMILLLIQSTLNLFVGHTVTGETSNIDVIIRTSTAAIFGYFLSTNFIRHASTDSTRKSGDIAKNVSSTSCDEIQPNIGLLVPDSDVSAEQFDDGGMGYEEDSGIDEPVACRLQIITASWIGLFCLIVLMILRNISALSGDIASSPSAIATVSQFRDLVSGCIGFLIGCPTSGTNTSK